MVNPFDRIVDDRTTTTIPSEQFYDDRLDRYGSQKSQWPAQIDRAAVDLLYGDAIGRADDGSIGGTIDRENFGDATGQHYCDGLTTLTGVNSGLATALDGIDAERLGTLAFKLNEFRNELADTEQAGLDLDRALAALVEKAATTAIETSSETTETNGRLPFNETTSVNDLLVQLFSDPDVSAYADTLIGQLSESAAYSENLLRKLDEPILTTPLWEPQHRALRAWHENGQTGYVEMATATGKTVLGLAAIALRYGALHPADTGYITTGTSAGNAGSENVRVLIVAGNNLILEQWRREFDTHLDIPPARTEPTTNGGTVIELDWGCVEFRTAPELLQASLSGYDFVILDEAHSYRRSGGETVRGWRDVFTELTDESEAVLALSGSIDADWTGDEAARNALDGHLDCLIEYDLTEAREDGIIADFGWQIQYAPADSATTERVAEQTVTCTTYHDAETGKLDLDTLGISLPEHVENYFGTYDALRAFVQSNAGRERRSASETFDEFASALLTRRPARWNLTPQLSAIADLLDRQPPERKCAVLVSGYETVTALSETLVEKHDYDPETVIALDGPNDRMSRIETFNEIEEAVIIGPGKLLGEGVDMPDAEVAINVAKGGVNHSLVQRIGRVLRNPDGEKHAQFYHVVAQPVENAALVPPEDGRRMLTRAAEFRALGERFDERPTFAVTSDAFSVVTQLERAGSAALGRHTHLWDTIDDENTRRELRALTHVIDADNDGKLPAQIRCWGGKERDKSTDPTATGLFLDDRQNEERNESADPGINAIKKRLDAGDASEDSDPLEAESDPSSEPSRDDVEEPQPDDPATVDPASNSEPDTTNEKAANSTPMSNDQLNLSDTGVPRDEDDSMAVTDDTRTSVDVDGVDERTTALMRVALNDLSGAADEKRRMRAVDALATGGEDVVRQLTRIADIDNAGNEAVAARAEEALVDILFESTFESS